MPMRRIPTSLPQVGFDDQASPMSEGLLHASATLGELWPRLAQIKADQRRQDQAMQERRMEFQEREADRQDRARLWSQNREDQISQRRDAASAAAAERKHRDDQDAARYGVYVGDDPQLKSISDQVRADRGTAITTKNESAQAAADERKARDDKALDDGAQKQAATEIAPQGRGFKTTFQTITDANGNAKQVPLKVPMNDQELADQNDRINSRALELRGHGFAPVPGFKEAAAADKAATPPAPTFIPRTTPASTYADPQPGTLWSKGIPSAEDWNASQTNPTPILAPTAPTLGPTFSGRTAAPASAPAPTVDTSPLDEAERDPAWKAKLDRKFPGRAADPAQRQAALDYVKPFYTPATTNAPAPAAP